MAQGKRVTEVYAYVGDDVNGDEGFPTCSPAPGVVMPLLVTDLDRARNLRPVAQDAATARGKPLQLVRFELVERMETVDPVAPGPPVSEPFQSFDRPIVGVDEAAVETSGVVVFAMHPDAIGVAYMVDGALLPPFIVRGKQAEDLAQLVADAWSAIKRSGN